MLAAHYKEQSDDQSTSSSSSSSSSFSCQRLERSGCGHRPAHLERAVVGRQEGGPGHQAADGQEDEAGDEEDGPQAGGAPPHLGRLLDGAKVLRRHVPRHDNLRPPMRRPGQCGDPHGERRRWSRRGRGGDGGGDVTLRARASNVVGFVVARARLVRRHCDVATCHNGKREKKDGRRDVGHMAGMVHAECACVWGGGRRGDGGWVARAIFDDDALCHARWLVARNKKTTFLFVSRSSLHTCVRVCVMRPSAEDAFT